MARFYPYFPFFSPTISSFLLLLTCPSQHYSPSFFQLYSQTPRYVFILILSSLIAPHFHLGILVSATSTVLSNFPFYFEQNIFLVAHDSCPFSPFHRTATFNSYTFCHHSPPRPLSPPHHLSSSLVILIPKFKFRKLRLRSLIRFIPIPFSPIHFSIVQAHIFQLPSNLT